jgi:hypothetical protein
MRLSVELLKRSTSGWGGFWVGLVDTKPYWRTGADWAPMDVIHWTNGWNLEECTTSIGMTDMLYDSPEDSRDVIILRTRSRTSFPALTWLIHVSGSSPKTSSWEEPPVASSSRACKRSRLKHYGWTATWKFLQHLGLPAEWELSGTDDNGNAQGGNAMYENRPEGAE